jgi:hypothetical protein
LAITHDYYGYKMTDDTGFAPCVDNSFLTLACCKTDVRERAPRNSWVAGFGGVRFGVGKLIYLMQVACGVDFDTYFSRSGLKGRLDNIYRRVDGEYRQIPTARCHTKPKEIKHDLSVDRVLIATRFVYFGKEKIEVRRRFEEFVPQARSYCYVDGSRVDAFVNWVFSHGSGNKGGPHNPLLPPSSALVLIR